MKTEKDIKILSREEFESLESTKKKFVFEKQMFEEHYNREISDSQIYDEMYESYKSRMNVALEQLEKANAGDAQAQYAVGTFFSNNDFLGVQDEEADYYYRLAAEQNHPFAALQLALSLRETRPAEAKEFYQTYKQYRTGPIECDVTIPEFDMEEAEDGMDF